MTRTPFHRVMTNGLWARSRLWPWNSWVRRRLCGGPAGACTPASDGDWLRALGPFMVGWFVVWQGTDAQSIETSDSMRVALCPVAKGSGWPMLSIVEASNTDTPQILEGHEWLTTLVLAVPHAFRAHSASL